MIRIAICLGLAACGRDVYLGELVPPADAMIDASTVGPSNPFTAGNYGIAFLDPSQANCSGTLTGLEGDFTVITRATLGLVDGPVTFATPDIATLAIAGSPIASRLGESSVTLVADISDPVWSGGVDGSFDAGPDATICQAIAVAADPATGSSTSGVEGAIAFLFSTSDTSGDCSITFGALFTKS